MPEESLRFFVERRERELVNRLDFARAQVNQLTAELAEVRRAKEALEPIETLPGATGVLAAHEERDTPLVLANDPYPGMGIKRLILLAFSDKPEFRAHGAKASQIREFIRNAYRRDIDRATLSPQISRLQRDGFIEAGGGGVWRLVDRTNMRFPGVSNTDEAPTGDDPDSAPESPDVGK
jgi:hypothetical protein